MTDEQTDDIDTRGTTRSAANSAGTLTRVSSLKLTRFRGVSTSITLDFASASHSAASMLIVGDNGSGKSTIVDGLEFVLQGKIGRSVSLQGRAVPAALSFYDSSGAEVQATFEDGRTIVRSVKTMPDGA